MRAPLPAVVVVLAAACGGAAPPDVAPTPANSYSIMYMGLDLPSAGTQLGGHYSGANFSTRQATYQLSDGLRNRWSIQARARGDAMLRGAGFRVRSVGATMSEAQEVVGVQYGLSGQVHQLSVRTTGPAEPYNVEVQTEIGWELLDLGSGSAVFGRAYQGVLRATGSLDTVVARALDESLGRLVADSAFLRALAMPRSDPDADRAVGFVRAFPPAGQLLRIHVNDILPAPDSAPVGRIAAGIVTLHGDDNALGTAFVLTRDGLAVTGGRELRTSDRIRARLPSGVDRPVRLLRKSSGLDVALIQLACPGECTTVDWEAPVGVPVFTNVVAVGAPVREGDPVVISSGRVGGRWGIAHGVTLEGMEETVDGGEPVARSATGHVFGLIVIKRGRRIVLLLDEVFRSLKVRVDAGADVPPGA